MESGWTRSRGKGLVWSKRSLCAEKEGETEGLRDLAVGIVGVGG